MTKENKKGYYIFSPFLRVFHWAMVVCVFALFATGLYIGDPGFSALKGAEPTLAVGSWFSMETIRKVHFIAGFVLAALFILRIYGAIRFKGDRLLPRFKDKRYWTGLVDTMKHYLFFPEKEEKHVLRNSMARTSYLAVYFLFVLEIATGFAMFAMVRPDSFLATIFNPINHLFTEYQVHLIHHYVAWCFMLFAIIHIYLCFRADLTEKNGEISSMVSGVKYFEHDPEDIEDIRDGK